MSVGYLGAARRIAGVPADRTATRAGGEVSWVPGWLLALQAVTHCSFQLASIAPRADSPRRECPPPHPSAKGTRSMASPSDGTEAGCSGGQSEQWSTDHLLVGSGLRSDIKGNAVPTPGAALALRLCGVP